MKTETYDQNYFGKLQKSVFKMAMGFSMMKSHDIGILYVYSYASIDF